MGLLGILSSFFWADRVDRRAIFMIGVAVCGLTQLGFAVAWTVTPGTETAGKVVVGLIAVFTFFYTAFGMPIRVFPTATQEPADLYCCGQARTRGW